ncbi:hypothetical protein PIB30_050752 [Stylosanthes scabra]|uniref:DUF4283 domain-containing protein n=1 Tax=Stylosanthes scabra TaxID=79078 RepID=A0ABU6TI72_9FABA|nr:hypothetical protein [Stylosanthes scabra]
MYRLLDDWKGPGEIECRGVDPYRCLITFEYAEARDATMGDELILSLFDEVIPHWEYFWSLSRRIWIEVMGLPIGLWCNENYNKIGKLWGKMVKLDDRTKESKSYSTARILLDCFQWERIHEWVSIKIEDRKFEVFVKEFGSEVYSVQSHPDLGTECSISMEEEKSTSMVEESPVEAVRTQAATNQPNLNYQNIDDPLSNAINDKWEIVQAINYDGLNDEDGDNSSRHEEKMWGKGSE